MKQIALIVGCCLVAAAQTSSPVLAAKDLLELESRMTQLMEAAGLAIPGLGTAGGPIREAAAATIEAQRRAPGSTSLNYRFLNQAKAWLATAEAFPRPTPFPPAGAQQFTELRAAFEQLQLNFEASLGVQEEQTRARNADPNQLSRYGADNPKLPPPAAGSARVVFFGDSITDFWRLNEYFTGKDFVNRGISGQTTTQMLARFQQDVIGLQPKVVVILAGTNDIGRGIPLKAIEDNLRMMGDLAKVNGIRPVFASVTPVSDYHKNVDLSYARTAERPPASIIQLNDWIRQNCQKESFPYVNYFSAMVDTSGQLSGDLSDDGLHPNAKGYRIMSPLVLNAINLALYDAPAAPQQPKKRFGSTPPQ
jgi:lysophospholipase L1-like esterase